MEKLKLKVCGLRQPEADGVAALGVDYMGFIFFPESPRFVGEGFTFSPPPGVQSVGVFVNESRSQIIKLLNTIGSRIAQLHGDEQPDQCEALRDLGYTVIKAIPVSDEMATSTLSRFRKSVDYFLFDTKGKLRGGNATRFDWRLLGNYDQRIPFFLSGGIRQEDLEELDELRNMNLYAVDVNSGVEHSPGVKDLDKVKRIKQTLDKF
jgi:phosphoribosylanthranilate isomerase